MEEERIEGEFDSPTDAGNCLIDGYMISQLLAGKFDSVHVRFEDNDMKATEFLRHIGYTKEKIVDRIVEKERAKLMWLNLDVPDEATMKAEVSSNLEEDFAEYEKSFIITESSGL